MADTVKPVHTPKHQQTDKQGGYAGIDTPNPFGCDTDTRMHLVMRGTACFGCEYLQAADPEDGEYGNGKHDDSQTANPLCHATPEQYAMGKWFDVIQNGGSRTAETGHGFKECIGNVGNVSAYIKRQYSEKGERYPGKADQYISVTACQLPFTSLAESCQ